MPSREERVFSAWLIVHQAEDLPGQWVAHCLDFDAVTQGNSLGDAVRMAYDAVGILVLDDLSHGLDPYGRRAPQSYWDELYAMLEKSTPSKETIESLSRKQSKIHWVACQISVHCEWTVTDHEERTTRCSMPIAFETPVNAA